MNIEQLISDLFYIKPEIAVAVTLVVIVVVDLIMGKNKKALPFISLVGLLIAGILVVQQFGTAKFVFKTSINSSLMAIDNFGSYFKIIVVVSSIFIVFFSLSSAEIKSTYARHGEYYSLIFGMILGMFFMVSAADLILIYLSMELLSLSSYVLAGFVKNSIRNSEASLKYVIYGGVSSGIMLFGISIIFGLTGSTNLYEINSLIQAQSFPSITLLLAGLFIIVGFGFKISAAPFHFWTPDVYEGAPIPITAFLSVASKAAGFAVLIRFIKVVFVDSVDVNGFWHLINVIDWKSIIILLSILTMTLGNFAALWQDNLKRMLAYSSIAHAGYMLLGVAVLSNEGIIAIMIYFIVYLFMNLGAFFVVMLVANEIGSEEIDDYKGLGRSIPLLGVALAIFLISLVGLPPTAGFIAKVALFIALIDANMIVVLVITILNTVVSVYYYIRILRNLYLVKVDEERPMLRINFLNKVFVLFLAVPLIVFGIYFTPIIDFAKYSLNILGL
ncbi:NADH-quinone oxidoreductase subunit N [bacterium BMS3Abin03]|nr:NADH-quinone oxidoreductase subunit N [bacterium BMS3Abin03]